MVFSINTIQVRLGNLGNTKLGMPMSKTPTDVICTEAPICPYICDKQENQRAYGTAVSEVECHLN